MEMTKIQLENERKIQQLQMQAINALWKKVSCMQKQSSNADSQDGAAGNQLNGEESNSVDTITTPRSIIS